MKTLEEKYAIISSMNMDGSKGSTQFSPEQLAICDELSQMLVDFNFRKGPVPNFPPEVRRNVAIVRDMVMAEEAKTAF